MTYLEAQQIILERAQLCVRDRKIPAKAMGEDTTASEFVDLTRALNRTVSCDVVSEIESPPFSNSAMDGFALRMKDTATFRDFAVCGSLHPGEVPKNSTPIGSAWEITTGAPVPLDCDTIIKIEDVEQFSVERARVQFKSEIRAGEFIRPVGQDYKKGSVVVSAGTRLKALHLMALASVNCNSIPVFKKPRVVLLPTGRELVQAGGRGEPGQIVNSSAVYLSTVWREMGCEVEVLPVLRDDPEAFERTLTELFKHPPDLLVTTGAVSMGNADFIRKGLENKLFQIIFHRVSVRPGKPILFAEKKIEGRRLMMFGLPGNPISTVVGSRFFVEPFLEVLLATKNSRQVSHSLPLKAVVRKPEGLRCFFRGHVMDGEVALHQDQGSSLIHPFVESEVWVVLPEAGERIEAGSRVTVLPFERNE